ncbi:hypothetical protein ColLi_07600 [Colletotrichum liriopes]|uniref:Uncharacterized protein n=1 Tax=Colletotrichum liriopes TaxID=708192 RepID=A0AA37LUC1_9PEZI|nr:hypothetical protein ColLi_07600 [Colletotrichum liriopes]
MRETTLLTRKFHGAPIRSRSRNSPATVGPARVPDRSARNRDVKPRAKISSETSSKRNKMVTATIGAYTSTLTWVVMEGARGRGVPMGEEGPMSTSEPRLWIQVYRLAVGITTAADYL